MGTTLRSTFTLAAVACATLTSATVMAQAYPGKPVRLILPVAFGSGTDINARLLMSEVTKHLGQPVVMENVPGADGIIGLEKLKNAAPDGYTFGLAAATFYTNPSLHTKLPYDSARDFVPVVQQAASPFMLAVTASLPVRSLKELIDYARANPGKLSSYGGNNSVGGLGLELIKMETGMMDIVGVPYKNVQQGFTDLLSGRIQLTFDNMATTLPHVRSGKLRALGVSTLKRSKAAPDIPTIDEAGVKGYDVTFPGGYVLPARTPREIVLRLNADINKGLQSPSVVEKYAETGILVGGGTPEQYAELIRSETARWAKVIKAAGIKAE